MRLEVGTSLYKTFSGLLQNNFSPAQFFPLPPPEAVSAQTLSESGKQIIWIINNEPKRAREIKRGNNLINN